VVREVAASPGLFYVYRYHLKYSDTLQLNFGLLTIHIRQIRKERRVQIPKLRYWRERRALTQEELAEKAGISARSVAGYEAGAGVRPGNVRKLAEALDVNVSALMMDPEIQEADSGKVEAPHLLEPSFNDVLEEERRTLNLELLAVYASRITDKMIDEIDAGHVTVEWGLAFYGQMTGMSMLFNEMMKLFPGPISEQGLLISRGEKQGLDRVSQALDKFDEVAKKLDKVLEPAAAQREREALKATFELIQGERSA
jgi:transcriptional regulator with XRE-family HTH domain